jgi:hypothetical protein
MGGITEEKHAPPKRFRPFGNFFWFPWKLEYRNKQRMFSAKSNKLGSCSNGYFVQRCRSYSSLYHRIIAAPYPVSECCHAPEVVIHRLSLCAQRPLRFYILCALALRASWP